MFYLFLAVSIVAIGWAVIYQTKELNRAEKKYLESLVQLARDPRNAQKRFTALALGRAYANLRRSRQGYTQFDEIRIMNELDAACAGAAGAPALAPVIDATPAPTGAEARLVTLDTLLAQNLISAEEYVRKRQQVLSEL